jgi:hypothetical protein
MRLSDYDSSRPSAEKPTPSPGPAKRRGGAFFAIGFGFLFAGVGGFLLGKVLPMARAAAEEARALPSATPVTLAAIAPGTRILLEARIAETAPLALREFVAYERHEFLGWREEGGRRRERWELRETVAPPFPLANFDDAPSAARLVNPGYALHEPPQTWRSTAELVFLEFGERTQRHDGFARGDAVVVDAIVDAAGGGALNARVLASGSRDAYLASLAGKARVLRIVGGIFFGVGLLIAFGGVARAFRS